MEEETVKRLTTVTRYCEILSGELAKLHWMNLFDLQSFDVRMICLRLIPPTISYTRQRAYFAYSQTAK